MDVNVKFEPGLRPCIVAGQKAMFHNWETFSNVVQPSPLKGGHNGCVVSRTLGIIEREDGTIHRAYPEEIRFIDGYVNQYFGENVTVLDFEKHVEGVENA